VRAARGCRQREQRDEHGGHVHLAFAPADRQGVAAHAALARAREFVAAQEGPPPHSPPPDARARARGDSRLVRGAFGRRRGTAVAQWVTKLVATSAPGEEAPLPALTMALADGPRGVAMCDRAPDGARALFGRAATRRALPTATRRRHAHALARARQPCARSAPTGGRERPGGGLMTGPGRIKAGCGP